MMNQQQKSKTMMAAFVPSKCQRRLNLQRFAGEGEGGDGGDGGSGNEGGNGSDGDGENQIVFKSQAELDSWYDKKAAKTFEKWEKAQEAKLAEAEKKGKMSAAEQAAYDLEQEKAKLAEDRQGLQREKDEASTIKRLVADKLPDALSAVFTPLYGGEEEALNTVYDAVVKAYRDGVEAGVSERLANSASNPAGNTGGSTSTSMGEKFAKSANSKTQTKTDLWGRK